MRPMSPALVVSLLAWAAAIPSASAQATGTSFVRAGKLIDVERGRVLTDQVIRIDGERIVSIADYRPDPAGAAGLIVYPHGDNARQFAYMVRYGLTPMDAIRSATLSSAQLLGLEQDIGSIAPGKYADLVAVGGDPLQDVDTLRQVRAVMKSGTVVPLD